ncbi:putative serine peptidase, putative,serine peptidase, clan SC, family S9D [Trypanosoma grayi]|uniref:putative serine peptidase, putative,serine peptidase, clan SC, family S9D n=1 Tax=Trypanosoma grayi TaxID=71804 RepID=UPI0004F481D6|nr:putative serine peptidase, putative,serine peptidase, clan SC, family S9D [Trypanosoma grayi]KEG13992.1 putative serine peptidase, putative,serine peptidase, clan SC, family S9D [Trypanosoma grayi]
MLSYFVFQPPGPGHWARASPIGDSLSVVKREGNAKIYYLYVKYDAASAASAEDKPLTILYSHGNAEDLYTCHEKLKWLSRAVGVDVVAYDYCGYGSSKAPEKGKCPTEQTVYDDAEAMYTEVTKTLKIQPDRIIVMGRSMGGGPSCYLAKKHHKEIGGLVLLSTFTSCLGVLDFLSPVLRWVHFPDMFCNIECLKEVSGCPVLIMHGKKDNVVPFRCSVALLETIEKTKRVHGNNQLVEAEWFETGTHNIEYEERGELARRLQRFLCKVRNSKAARSEL